MLVKAVRLQKPFLGTEEMSPADPRPNLLGLAFAQPPSML